MALRASDLVAEMERAFGDAWQAEKGSPLPAAGAGDRRLLFEGVARGLLRFIDERQDGVLTRITFQESGQDAQTHTVVGTRFDIERD